MLLEEHKITEELRGYHELGEVDQPGPRSGDTSHSDVNQRLGGDYGSKCVLGLKLKCSRGPLNTCRENTNHFFEERIRKEVDFINTNS